MRSIENGCSNCDLIWISIAFVCGFAVLQVGLPPLIGFIVAGFILKGMGLISGFTALEAIADIGVMVMLFTIGLKLHVRSLLKPEIWATTSIHTVFYGSVVFGGLIFLLSTVGLPLFTSLNITQTLLIGFALSFSSTVFAVKIFEERGTMSSRYGQVAIGILVVQDIFAVIFMTFTKGSIPSLWALALPPFLWVMRKILFFFFFLFTRYHLRARTALFSTAALSNYSEFGLIVAAVGAKNGWLNDEWLIILALTMSLSFVVAVPLNSQINKIFDRFSLFFKWFQSDECLPGEEPPVIDGIDVVVCGMGRIGSQVFDVAVEKIWVGCGFGF